MCLEYEWESLPCRLLCNNSSSSCGELTLVLVDAFASIFVAQQKKTRTITTIGSCALPIDRLIGYYRYRCTVPRGRDEDESKKKKEDEEEEKTRITDILATDRADRTARFGVRCLSLSD